MSVTVFFLRLIFYSLWLTVLPAFAMQGTPQPAPLKIGLVLGGGGARGLAHIGVLKALEEMRVPIHCIVGTSMGALVGGSYAAGRLPDELLNEIPKIDWEAVFNSRIPRQLIVYQEKRLEQYGQTPFEFGVRDNLTLGFPRSVLGTQNISFVLRKLTFGGVLHHFDDLAIPYRALATDLQTGKLVVLEKGDLVEAMRASMAVPGVFPPVEIAGHTLVDGGISRNLGVDVARKLGADVVIVVDTGTKPKNITTIENLFDVGAQIIRLITIQNERRQLNSLTSRDVVICPYFGQISNTDFDLLKKIIAAGIRATKQQALALAPYAVSDADYQHWRRISQSKRLYPKPIEEVRVTSTRYVNPQLLEKMLKLKLGEPIDQDALNKTIVTLYARGDFSQLTYQLTPQGEGARFTLMPMEKSWGPNYLNLGLALSTDFDWVNRYAVTARYRRTWINRLGAQWQVLLRLGQHRFFGTEFYQPLHLNRYAFVAPYANYDSEPLILWKDETRFSEYRHQHYQLGFDLGSSFTRYGEIRMGPVADWHNVYKESDTADRRLLLEHHHGVRQKFFLSTHQQNLGVHASAHYDQLDHTSFPYQGASAYFKWYYSLLGRQRCHEQWCKVHNTSVAFQMKQAFHIKKLGAYVSLRGNCSQGPHSLVSNLQRLGGFLNLSGYTNQHLFSNRLFYASLMMYYPVSSLLSKTQNVYLGGGVELAKDFSYLVPNNIFSDKNSMAMSLTGFVGVDTLLGTFYLGVSHNAHRKKRFYLTLGNPF